MAEFKVIYKLTQDWDAEELSIPWAEGCPLAVEKMQVARNVETGEAYFQAKLKNISDREVLSYKALFTCCYEDGTEEQKPVETLDADIAAGGYAEIRPLKLSRGDVKNVRLSICALKTTLGNWESEGEITHLPPREVLLLDPEAKKERIYQLKMSGCAVFPTAENHCCESHGSWWRCACGAINVGYAKCRFCGIDPEIEKGLRDKDQLVAAVQDRKAEEEGKKKLEEESREERKRLQQEKLDRATAKVKIFFRKHKKKILVPTVVACLIVAIAGVAFYVSIPEKAFAVYSDSDNSLTFYKEKFVPNSGSTFKGKNCTSVYEGVEELVCKWGGSENSDDNPAWVKDHAEDIDSVSFKEEIEPISLRGWFTHLVKCDTIDLKNLNTSKVTDFSYMFFNCSSVKQLDLSSFDTRQAVSFSRMFKDCDSLDSLDLSSFDTRGAYEFDWMFEKCSGLTSIDVSSFNTESATDMNGMFYECRKLKNLDLRNFSTNNVKDMSWMFKGCSTLAKVDLGSFDTSSVESFEEMFEGCSSLEQLDLSSFDTSVVKGVSDMFSDCTRLKSIRGAESWNVSKCKTFEGMFCKCPSLSLDCSKWDVSSVESGWLRSGNGSFNEESPNVVAPAWPADESLAHETD